MNKKYVNQISALLLSSAIAVGTAGRMTSVVFDAESDVYSCSFSRFWDAIYMLTKSFKGHSIRLRLVFFSSSCRGRFYYSQ